MTVHVKRALWRDSRELNKSMAVKATKPETIPNAHFIREIEAVTSDYA